MADVQSIIVILISKTTSYCSKSSEGHAVWAVTSFLSTNGGYITTGWMLFFLADSGDDELLHNTLA